MKKLFVIFGLVFLCAAAFAEQNCRVLVSVLVDDSDTYTDFAIVNVTNVDGKGTYSTNAIPGGETASIRVPCNETYNIAGTMWRQKRIASATSDSSAQPKGEFVYPFGDITLAAPNGSISIVLPFDFF